MPASTTVSIRLPQMILREAEERGVRSSELLKAAEIDPEVLADEDARVPLRAEQTLWAEAAARTGDPLFGLHVSQRAPTGALGIFELLCRSAGTFREATEVADRYLPIVHGGTAVRVEESAGVARFVTNIAKTFYEEKQAFSYYLFQLITMGLACTGRQPRILKVSLPHPAPSNRAELEELVRASGTSEIEFDAENIELAFGAEALNWRGPAAAPRLNRILRGHAEILLSELPGKSSFLLRVHRQLLEELGQGRASLPHLARSLGMEPRSLQRRLAGHGTSFGELLESVRKEAAASYLLDESMGLAEVSFRLGFSSPQSFHRAFRAWTGMTPGSWRREHMEEQKATLVAESPLAFAPRGKGRFDGT